MNHWRFLAGWRAVAIGNADSGAVFLAGLSVTGGYSLLVIGNTDLPLVSWRVGQSLAVYSLLILGNTVAGRVI